jgi:peptide-methionine (S)-S-oxide reductase
MGTAADSPRLPSYSGRTMGKEVTTLGGGCFWCLEAVYDEMIGVLSVESGYMGGLQPNPTYEQVCSGRTGHIEVVQVSFDPEVTTFHDVLEVFLAIHDPTSRDRQGNDAGSQYRSVIFYHSEAQKEAAEAMIRELDASETYGKPIVTEVRPASAFYVAEDYHQDYFQNNPGQPYCGYVVAPKVAKFRKQFAAKLRQADR